MTVSLKESITSKKFIFVIGCVGALFGFAVVAAWKLILMAPMYDAFVGGVIALAGIYLTGNVANKFVVGKHAIDKTVADQGVVEISPEESPEPPAPKK